MANAKKLPSGNWRIQIYLGIGDDGKKHKKSITAPTKWECEKLADEYLQGRGTVSNNLTVGECIDKYIEMRKNVLSPSTIKGYREIRKTRLQMLMNCSATKLTSQKVQQAVSFDALRLSRKSISEAVHLMKSALKMQGVQIELQVTYPPKKSEIKELPPPQAVMDAIKGTSIELPCLLAMCLGLRCSEVRALCKSDLKDEVLYIHKRKLYVDGADIVQDMNKNETSCRAIHCPQFLIDKIAECPTDELCPLTYPQLANRLRSIMKKHGLDISFHGLRHLNASIMLILGIPDKYAMERGGWSSASVMKSHYQNLFSDERMAVDRTVEEYFKNIFSRESSHEQKNKG